MMWENGPEFQLGITRDNGRDKAAADFDYNGYIHSHMTEQTMNLEHLKALKHYPMQRGE